MYVCIYVFPDVLCRAVFPGIHRGVEFHELSQNDDSDIFDNAEGDFFRDVGEEPGVEMLSRH